MCESGVPGGGASGKESAWRGEAFSRAEYVTDFGGESSPVARRLGAHACHCLGGRGAGRAFGLAALTTGGLRGRGASFGRATSFGRAARASGGASGGSAGCRA